jgi:hypothetical protein
MLSKHSKRKMIAKKTHDQYNDHPTKHSPLTKPESFPTEFELEIEQEHLR